MRVGDCTCFPELPNVCWGDGLVRLAAADSGHIVPQRHVQLCVWQVGWRHLAVLQWTAAASMSCRGSQGLCCRGSAWLHYFCTPATHGSSRPAKTNRHCASDCLLGSLRPCSIEKSPHICQGRNRVANATLAARHCRLTADSSTVYGRQSSQHNCNFGRQHIAPLQQTAPTSLWGGLSCAQLRRPGKGKRWEVCCSMHEGRYRDVG